MTSGVPCARRAVLGVLDKLISGSGSAPSLSTRSSSTELPFSACSCQSGHLSPLVPMNCPLTLQFAPSLSWMSQPRFTRQTRLTCEGRGEHWFAGRNPGPFPPAVANRLLLTSSYHSV